METDRIGRTWKVVWQDGNQNKALKGILKEEDQFFYKFLSRGNTLIISKKAIISMIEPEPNEKEWI